MKKNDNEDEVAPNTTFNIGKDGDLLEIEAAGFIRSSLPGYEEIWKRFIGHDGNGIMAKMDGLSEDEEKIRAEFAQHHYTILESLYFMKLIAEDFNELKAASTFRDYVFIMNQVMAFYAHSGRVRDNLGKCFTLIGNPAKSAEAHAELDPFYQERHIYVHGKKVPFGFDESGLPKLASDFKKNDKWNSVTKEDLNYTSEILIKHSEELTKKVNSLLMSMVSDVKRRMEIKSSKPVGLIKSPSSQYGTIAGQDIIITKTAISSSIKH